MSRDTIVLAVLGVLGWLILVTWLWTDAGCSTTTPC